MASFDSTNPPLPVPLYGKVKDIAGHRFSKWTVLYFVGAINRVARWVCKCDCGTQRMLSQAALRQGRTKTCGCSRNERPDVRKHGLCDAPGSRNYYHMRDRCTNPKHIEWEAYGGRGIAVCNRWLNGTTDKYGIECFFEDMGAPPERHSIDRINNEGGYWCGKCPECIELRHPSNCRWATSIQQANNTRANVLLTFQNRTHTISEWGRILDIKGPTLWNRLNLGWSIDRTLSTPVRLNKRWHPD